jgi:hypothetical protein
MRGQVFVGKSPAAAVRTCFSALDELRVSQVGTVAVLETSGPAARARARIVFFAAFAIPA